MSTAMERMRHPERFFIRDSRHPFKIFGNLKFWAENGIICIETMSTHEYETCQVEEWECRILALMAQVAHEKYADERDELIRGLEAMQAVGRAAIAQGNPFDAMAIDYMRRHERRHGISVPGAFQGTYQKEAIPTTFTRADKFTTGKTKK